MFVFRTLDDCDAIIELRAAAHARRGDRRRPARARGGPRPARARARSPRRAPDAAPDGDAARRAARARAQAHARARWACSVHLEKATTGVLGEQRTSRACASPTARRSTCEMVVVSAGIRPNAAAGARQAGLDGASGASSSATTSRCRATRSVYAVGECAQHRGQRLRAGRAAVGAGAGAGRPPHRTQPDAVYRLARVHQAQGDGRRPRGDGREGADERDDEVVTYVEPSRGIYKKLIVRDGRLAGAIVLGDRGDRAGAAAGLRPRHAAARRPRRAALPARGRRERRHERRRRCPTTRRSATATACRRARSSRRCRAVAAR